MQSKSDHGALLSSHHKPALERIDPPELKCLFFHAAPLTIAVMPGILMVVKNVFTMAPDVETMFQIQAKSQQQEDDGLLIFSLGLADVSSTRI